ncbi:MAG TPA: glycosyltransferase family 2 protein [Rhizomicrobium sp.]|jgi:glycosyltransferase involved in cell wall biosynthesis
MPEVTVCIPSFRRPKGLAKLLAALGALETRAAIVVVVADNDSERHEASDLCAETSSKGYRWPLDCVIVPERGIAQARNALVERALSAHQGEFIAMLDDDEWPAPQWLDEFLRIQRQTCADALHGGVVRDYETYPGATIAHCNGMGDWREASGPIGMIESTSNVLLRRACLERMAKPWFDPGFALTGGEDRDFFTRLKKSGATFAWADDALIHADVPATRATLGWALKRAYRVGNSDMRVFLKYRPPFAARGREIAKILGVFALSPLMLVASAPVASRRGNALAKVYRAAGKIAALFGRHYNEYAVTHGS